VTWNTLSPARARLLAALRERLPGGAPLTATQQGIWLAEQLSPGESGYHDTAALRIDGALDAAALRQALDDVQAQHAALRCRVIESDGVLKQFFDVDEVHWGVTDLTALPADGRRVRLGRLVAALATEPFEVATGPLWRARLVRLGAAEHVLVLVVHHLIADGWSHGVLLGALLDRYAARTGGRDDVPPATGADYRTWLARRVRREHEAVAAGAAAEVVEDLCRVPYRLRLPGFDPAPADRAAAEVEIPLGAPEWMAFDLACTRSGTTRFMALTGLFAAMLSRATDRADVLLSMPLAGRYDEATVGLLGCLINVVPVGVRIATSASPRAAVDAGAAAVWRALRHAELPYREVVRAVDAALPGDDPLTNVGIEQFNAPTGEVRMGSLRVEPLPRAQVRLRHDLTLSVARDGGGPTTLLYPAARWSKDRVAGLAVDLAELVKAATAALVA
jgi:Condensation domain